jgi:hypothetical protein
MCRLSRLLRTRKAKPNRCSSPALSILQRPQAAVDGERNILRCTIVQNYVDLVGKTGRQRAAQKLKRERK